ncbi:DUF2510 domain-containing protein [Ruania zhangjianzhongii]|uniref:DUF2510 domain-containing protein n=1 Tax=Ruania zhangjianzhongii TaxID=2603206 RepID=UPI001AEFF035|nr:DUF2510 domain-containing protein [Ruania zhangjianzhongii]
MTAPVPPGWHRDPRGGPLERWWDGRQWTGHTRPSQPVAAAGPGIQPSTPHPQQQHPAHQQGQASYQQGSAGWQQGSAGWQQGNAGWQQGNGGYQQAAGGGYPGTGHQGPGYPGSQPPAKKHGLTALLVVVSALALFIIVAVVGPFGNDPDTSASTPTPSTPSATPTPTPEETYTIMDRPGYDAAVNYLDELSSWLSTAYDDGTIYDYVPNTDEGRTYAAAVLQLIGELRVELSEPGEPTSDTDALDTRIEEIQDQAQQYSEAFENGQDLGVRVEVEWNDGTTTTTDGTFPEAPSTDPDDYADAEEFAQAYVAQPDGDGSFAPAAEQIAAAFDLELFYDHDAMFSACEYPDNYELLGGFCPSSPGYVYINDQYSDYPNVLQNEGFVHTVRHEIAHSQILAICGTLSPPAAGENWEGVTNSYAVNYLGADPDWLFVENEYAISAQTEEVAQQIHEDQQCQ